MRVAALYDVHANFPALEAVLEDVRDARVDRVVIGGDVLPGPMPRETLARLTQFDVPVDFIYGNGERAVLAQMDAAGDPARVTYWGTASGKPLADPHAEVLRWTAQQLDANDYAVIHSWPKTVSLTIPPLGDVLFCHGTPRSEVECFTRLTPEELLRPLFEGFRLVVCGHTHMAFDRTIGTTRVVNAGSVGMPFGDPGADWLLLGPAIELRHTWYDLAKAANRVRQTAYPQAKEFAEQSILNPPAAQQMLDAFTHLSFR